MAFIFSTSHLPETRVRRTDHLEDDEEEDDVMQPMPRADGVRAFSHLPVRDNPAASTGPLREDSPHGGIVPIPPRSATPSTSGSPMAEAQDDAPPPEADSAPEDDTAPQDHADDRPWYMPASPPKTCPRRITLRTHTPPPPNPGKTPPAAPASTAHLPQTAAPPEPAAAASLPPRTTSATTSTLPLLTPLPGKPLLKTTAPPCREAACLNNAAHQSRF